MNFYHASVLLDEAIEALAIRPDGIYLDGTLGGAGHSLKIAERLTTGRLIGVDRDAQALEAAAARLAPYMERVSLVHANYRALDGILDRYIEDLGGSVGSIVATGGLASTICPACRHEITLDNNLLLKGLYVIYKKNIARKGRRPRKAEE